MDVPETAQYTGSAGGGEWGSGDTIGQYGVIAAAATTDAAGAPRHANGTGQQAGGSRADVRRAAGDRCDGRGGSRGACGECDDRAGGGSRPPHNGKWSDSTWAPGGYMTPAGWLAAARFALAAVLAAMAWAVKAVVRAGRPLCCHGCEDVHAGGMTAVKLAARARRKNLDCPAAIRQCQCRTSSTGLARVGSCAQAATTCSLFVGLFRRGGVGNLPIRAKPRWVTAETKSGGRSACPVTTSGLRSPRRGALARMVSGINGTMCARALPGLRHVWAELPQCGVVLECGVRGPRGQRLACGSGLPARAPTRGCGACSRLPTPYRPAQATVGADPRPSCLVHLACLSRPPAGHAAPPRERILAPRRPRLPATTRPGPRAWLANLARGSGGRGDLGLHSHLAQRWELRGRPGDRGSIPWGGRPHAIGCSRGALGRVAVG